VNSTDASFAGTVAAQKQKQFNGIDALEKRLLQAQKRKLVDQVGRLSELHETIFPGESLQERHNNFFQFYLEYGEEILPLISKSLDPLQLEFSWIELP
ncbi:bacillithiol biosynthesis BshC, partial [Flavobacteriaceae bacterium]|nr:bacillithiol biosynthesis BshC [Flavobacteriaceae bacterium]